MSELTLVPPKSSGTKIITGSHSAETGFSIDLGGTPRFLALSLVHSGSVAGQGAGAGISVGVDFGVIGNPQMTYGKGTFSVTGFTYSTSNALTNSTIYYFAVM